MPGQLAPPKYLLLSACAFLALNGAALLLCPAKQESVSYLFMIAATVLALATCIAKCTTASPETRLHWVSFTSAIFLWTAGMSLSAWEDLVTHADASTATYADLSYFLYGVPLVLIISLPAQEKRVMAFFGLDVIQVTAVAVLTYLSFYSTLPFLNAPAHPVPAPVVAAAFFIENVALAAGATLRMTSISNGELRDFFRTLNIFLWTYALFATVYNELFLHFGKDYSLLTDVPFLLLSVTNLSGHRGKLQAEGKSEGVLAQYIDHGSPVFFTVVLIGLGLSVSRSHYYIGAGVIMMAAVAYAIRVTVLQVRYMQSQRSLEAARRQLEVLSVTDGLTGLGNRRSFDAAFEREWSRAIRDRTSLGLLMIDIDFFKRLNDHYGHAHGDECLRVVAQTLQQCVGRATDIAARYGGEEFAVILPASDEPGTQKIAERICSGVSALKLPNLNSEIGYVTVSIGLAVSNKDRAGSAEALLQLADHALYRAKQAGRNRVEAAPQGHLDATGNVIEVRTSL